MGHFVDFFDQVMIVKKCTIARGVLGKDILHFSKILMAWFVTQVVPEDA